MLECGADMNTPTLHFLGWDAPAIELVADRLLRLNEMDSATFRRATVVVPTAESGRRLREYMAERAGRPLLMPRIKQATQLVPCTGSIEEASEYAAWIRVLSRREPKTDWPTLFPENPAIKLNWSRGMAQRLMQLRRQLEAACLTPQLIQAGQVEERESRRWGEMGEIFDLVDEQIKAWGYKLRQTVYDAAAAQAAQQYRGKRLILACLPQITESFRAFTDAVLRAGGEVDIYIHAPQEKRQLFDSRYGTPLSDWAKEDIDIPNEYIHVTANGTELAAQALAACRNHIPKEITLGNCDSAFAPVIRNAFCYAGWPLNMPEGRSFMSTEAGQLPSQLLRATLRAGDCYATEPLLRNQALQRSRRLSPAMQHSYSLWLDNAMQKQMPAAMSDLLELATRETEQAHILNFTEDVQKLLNRLNDSEQLPDTLTELGRNLEKAYSGSEMSEAMHAFAETTAAVAQVIRRVPEFCRAAEALSMLQALVQQRAGDTMGLVATRKHETVLDASGWMELPFCPGSRLILCGLHENCVPESPSIDAFLPESLCRKYPQLPDMEQRIARDSFLLTALLRAHKGNTCIITAKATDDGTPIVPSQLLLRCPENPPSVLLQRVATLFDEKAPKDTPEPPATWQMRTPLQQVAALETIDLLGSNLQNPWQDPQMHFSPSRLASFLSCPLRFWLKTLLHMDPQDIYEPGKNACNPAEYGTILHKVLELLVEQYPIHTPGLNAETIYQTSRRLLDEQFEIRFGKKLSMPLLAQKLMMDSNLSLFAERHLADLQEGWECILREHHIEDCSDGEDMWKFEGDAVFHMTIDRVDRKPRTDGRGYLWRIVDYKTGDYSPQDKHLHKLGDDCRKAFMRFMPDFPLLHEEVTTKKQTKEYFYRWKELQLPLYAQWLMDTQQIGLEDIEVGYYLLPRSKKDCLYKSWNISEQQQQSAMLWVRTAVRTIRSGQCLVSAESLKLTAYADFGALAQEGDPRLMMGLPALTTEEN